MPCRARPAVGRERAKIESAAARDREAVGARDGDRVAKADTENILAAHGRVFEVRTLIAQTEPNRALPSVGDLGLARRADEVLPVGLERIVRRPEEADAVRRFMPPVNPSHGAAEVGVVANGHAEPARERHVPVLVVGQVVVGPQVRELAEVIEPADDAAD